MKSKEYEVSFSCYLRMEEVVELVGDAIGHDNVVEFIKNLELYFADWGLSEDLYQHFLEQHRIYLEEVDDD